MESYFETRSIPLNVILFVLNEQQNNSVYI
jgi:hypothetical protein